MRHSGTALLKPSSIYWDTKRNTCFLTATHDQLSIHADMTSRSGVCCVHMSLFWSCVSFPWRRCTQHNVLCCVHWTCTQLFVWMDVNRKCMTVSCMQSKSSSKGMPYRAWTNYLGLHLRFVIKNTNYKCLMDTSIISFLLNSIIYRSGYICPKSMTN